MTPPLQFSLFEAGLRWKSKADRLRGVLDKRRAERCKYVVCVRNRNNPDHRPEGDEPHSHAFLVAENKGLEPRGHRWLIRFGQVAAVDQHVDWRWRDKVYTNLSLLGIRERRVARSLIDVGCQIPFSRSGHSASPKHAPIVNALRSELEGLGWRVASDSAAVEPDLVMSRNDMNFMFEIKPDSSQGSFFTALGQLLVYRHALSTPISRAFLVAPDYPLAERSAFEAILASLKLELLRFSVAKGAYGFPGLTSLFR